MKQQDCKAAEADRKIKFYSEPPASHLRDWKADVRRAAVEAPGKLKSQQAMIPLMRVLGMKTRMCVQPQGMRLALLATYRNHPPFLHSKNGIVCCSRDGVIVRLGRLLWYNHKERTAHQIRKGAPLVKILVDADGCPVVDITLSCARRRDAAVLLICDTAHHFEREGAQTVTVPKGADSADFRLVNMVEQGDIVVTQDYGLAAMALAKRAHVLNQNGMEYTSANIDSLLLARHTARKIRRGGGRLKGPAKRTKAQDAAFQEALCALLEREPHA